MELSDGKLRKALSAGPGLSIVPYELSADEAFDL